MKSMLFLLSFLLLSSRAMSSYDAVLDSDGDELQRAQPYYALLLLLDIPIAGLKLVYNNSCPLQPTITWAHLGEPVAFFPEDSHETTIREGSALYVTFSGPTVCPDSNVWMYDIEKDVLTTGGTTSSSACPPDTSRFVIHKTNISSPGYMFDYCPCSIGVNRPSRNIPCSDSEGLMMRKMLPKMLPLIKRNDIVDFGFVFVKYNGGNESVIPSAALLSKSYK